MIQIKYCPSSDTIRQMPQNYLLAHRIHNGRCWSVGEIDTAADKVVAVIAFLALLEYDAKWQMDGYTLANKIQEEYNKRASQEKGYIFDLSYRISND